MRSELVFFVVSVVLMGALWWWLSRSWYGRAVRAVSSNRGAAKLMGINPRTTEIVSFAAAGILASFAGVAIYSYGVIQPAYGHALTVKAFIITVLAGVGSVPGVFVGALLLGVTEALTVTFASSALQELAGRPLVLLGLVVRPPGLCGAARRRGCRARRQARRGSRRRREAAPRGAAPSSPRASRSYSSVTSSSRSSSAATRT